MLQQRRPLLMLFLLLLLLPPQLILASITFVPYLCPNGWDNLDGRCLHYLTNLYSAQRAAAECTYFTPTFAGESTYKLIDPRTAAENTWLHNKCKDNDGVFPSAWNVWTGPTTLSPTTSVNPANIVTSPAGQPVYTCVCEPPLVNSNYPNWCIPVASGTWGQGLVYNGRCTAAPSNSVTSKCTGNSVTTCRRPPQLHPSPAKTGRGACWIGADRKGITSTAAIEFSALSPVTKKLQPLNLLHEQLNAMATDTNAQSLYVRTVLSLNGAQASPNCVAQWNWDGTGTWVMDFCNKELNSACVADARCPAGFRRTTNYAVSDTGAITLAKCQACPAGTFRTDEQFQNTCTNCPIGYFGALGTNRTSSTCSGACPAGTWCAAAAGAATPCGAGYYGKPVTPGNPGWGSFELGCLNCPAGKYCNKEVSVFADAKPCNAGYCGYDKQSSATCSKTCTPGYYCPAGQPCPGRQCGDGYLGANYASGANAYCPDGSQVPSRIPVGYYGIGENSMTWSAAVVCTNGFYCTGGQRVPCAAGFYSATSFSDSERASCKPCMNGYYCAPPADSTSPGATSPNQAVCAPPGAEHPALHYCVAGIRTTLPVDSNLMTVPVDVALDIREGAVPCPADKVCQYGIAYNRLDWVNCPDNVASVTIPELWSSPTTTAYVLAKLQDSIPVQDYKLNYTLISQSYADPTQLAGSACSNGLTRNDGIFAVNSTSGYIQVKRFAPNPFDPTAALDFEACEPITDLKYRLEIRALARHVSQPITAALTCTVTVTVKDENDQPVFDRMLYHRVIKESAAENTQAARCNGKLSITGCPDDSTPNADNAVSATDQDSFGQGNLDYSFVNLSASTTAHSKLAINTCTGLISQKGGPDNVLRFSDPTLSEVPGSNGKFRYMTYTVRVSDDGNGNPANVRYSDTTVYVYVENINDAPEFVPVTATIYVPESTTANRWPAGTITVPSQFQATDDDPADIVELSLSRNDGAAFALSTNGVLSTTFEGARTIDFESSKKSYSIDIEARDNGNPPLSALMTLTIYVANSNDPPVIESNPVFYILEDAAPGAPVCRGDESTRCTLANLDAMHRIQVTDPDNLPEDIITFQLTSNPNNMFRIDEQTGQVYLNTGKQLDFESMPDSQQGTGRVYTLQVTAFSSGGGIPNVGFPIFVENATMAFNVFVVDVNEAPQFDNPVGQDPFKVVETWPVGVVLDQAVIIASDPDNADLVLKGVAAPKQTLTFSAVADGTAQDGEAFFAVTTNPTNGSLARIVLKKALDFENAPLCIGNIPCYSLRIRVADNGNPQRTAERVFWFHLVNVNEAPTFAQPQYSLVISENATYGSQITIPTSFVMRATDVDAGDNNLLTYTVTGGDGYTHFDITMLGPNLGFAAYKRANVLLDYETKSTYTLRIRAEDAGASSSIGRACTLNQGVSVGCNEGAICRSSRCYELCPNYLSSTLAPISSQDVPYDGFFCRDLSGGAGGYARETPKYKEWADVVLAFTVLDSNDKPFVVDRSATVPQPTELDNVACVLKGQVKHQTMNTATQSAFRTIPVWDDDKPNPGPNAGPFTFAVVAGNEQHFTANRLSMNTTTGEIKVLQCTSGCLPLESVMETRVRVTDRGGLSSECAVQILLTNANTAPFLGGDLTLSPINEGVFTDGEVDGVPQPIVLSPALSAARLLEIDGDGDEVLTFSASWSTYFNVNPQTMEITMRAPIDYEASFTQNFVQSILISVTDKQGASDSFVINIPVLDVNEAPIWKTAELPNYVANVVQLTLPENSQGDVLDFSGFVTDPDIYAVDETWRQTTISLLQTDANCSLATCLPLEMTPQGVLRVKTGAVLDFEIRNQWSFVMRVTDGPGLYSDLSVSFSLLDINEPPRFTSSSGNASVAEGNGGSSGRDLLDMTLFVTDPDAADPPQSLVFNITEGNEAGIFEIRAGKLRIISNRILDFEDVSYYPLTVEVKDHMNLTATGPVAVYVTNMNDVQISSIDVVTPLSCTTPGKVKLTGTNFGMKTPAVGTQFELSYTRKVVSGSAAPTFTTMCPLPASGNTELLCDLTQGGAGAEFSFVLKVTLAGKILGDASARFATVFGFPAPTLVSVAGATLMPTSGGNTVTLTGTCLGKAEDLLTFGNSTASDSFVEFCQDYNNVCTALPRCSVTAAGTQITCLTAIPPGLGPQTKFRVRIATNAVDYLVQGSYAVPTVTSTSVTSLKTDGTIAAGGIVITGTNFGALNSVPERAILTYVEGEYSQSFALLGCKVTSAYLAVTCTSTAHGFGTNIRVYLTFGTQTNTVSQALLNFERPSVTGISTPGNVASPSKGGLLVTLTGISFGPVCGNPGVSATDGAVNCPFIQATYTRGSLSVSTGLPIVYTAQYCAIVSQTSIVCGTVPGTGKDHKWTLRVAMQTAPATNFTTRYSSPTVGTYEGDGALDAVTRGGQEVLIRGNHFGPRFGAPIRVFYGNEQNSTEFTALDCAVETDHEVIRCITAVGAGNNLGWQVIVDEQLSRSELSSYGAPIIYWVNLTSTSTATDLNVDGNQLVTLTGNNFGVPNTMNFLERVIYGPAGNPALYDVTSQCTVTTHETLACRMLAGAGTNLTWKVTVRGQSSPASNAVSSYASPQLLSLSNLTSPTAGGGKLTLNVTNLAFCDPNAKVRIVFGPVFVDTMQVYAPNLVDPLDTTVFCHDVSVAQGTRNRRIVISIPEMTGANVVDVRLRVEAPAYNGGVFQTPVQFKLTYDPPRISDVYAEPGESGSSIRVTLAGINFCKTEGCCQTFLDNTPLPASSVISHDHTVISFIAPGPGSAQVKCNDGTVLSNIVEFSSRNPYVYGAVRASDFMRLDQATFNTVGNQEVYVFAFYASPTTTLTVGGLEVSPVAVDTFECSNTTFGFQPNTIDGVSMLITPGQPCYRIRGRVPPGQGVNNEVVISTGSLKSKADDYRFEFLQYTAPAVTALSATFLTPYPTQGTVASLLEITGTDFGLQGEIVFGNATTYGTRMEIVCRPGASGYTWSHTKATCHVPAGEGQALQVRIRAGAQNSLPATQGSLRYIAPTITSFQVINSTQGNTAETVGGQTLVLTGLNFGRPYNSMAVTTSTGYASVVKLGTGGVKGTCALQRADHTTVRCTIPPGDGAGLDLNLFAQNYAQILAPTKFSYSIPVVTSITPSVASTNGMVPGTSDRQVFRVFGRNFGATDTKLQFVTESGYVIVLAERRPADVTPLVGFITVSHTELAAYLPAYVGKNIQVQVIATRQASVGGPTFSYEKPTIGVVTMSNGNNAPTTSPPTASSGRRRLQVGDFTPLIDNIAWTSVEFGHCLSLPSMNDTDVGTSYAYRVRLDITDTGAYSQAFTIHKLTDYTSATTTACTNENKVSDVSRQGQFVDLGELPEVGCVRAYQQTVTAMSGNLPAQLFPEGGYGLYAISEKIDLYTSLPSFADYASALGNSSSASFAFEDKRTATLTDGPLQDTLQVVPTTGCVPGYWEDISAYQARLDASTTFAILPRICHRPVIITIEGDNFGTDTNCGVGVVDCILYVSLVDLERNTVYEASTTSSEGNHGILCAECVRTNTLASFQVPFGAGRNLYINVTVGGQSNLQGPYVHYEPPRVDYVSPGSLNTGNSFQAATGNENVQLIGDNLGYYNTSLSILFNGRPCSNASWVSGRLDRNGQDSLECKTTPDVVGLKSVFLCVGGQSKIHPFTKYRSDVTALQYGQENNAWNVSGSPLSRYTSGIYSYATARCPNGFYGRLGEICLPCPEGGACFPAIAQPVAKPDFFRLEMNSSSERAELGGACRRERIDSIYREIYPELVQFETCDQVVKCIPASSCLGENKCAVGYEYQLKRCNLVRENMNNTCRTWYDGKTKQYRGVNADCQKHTVPGASCDHAHPEDCSACVLHFADAFSPPTGTCECQVSERCSLCTASEYYRLNGECIACPDNPALVFTLFILAGLAVIAFAYWFQKKKINLAFISIGVDYFQVLAVLSTTNVPWPPLIRSIFQIFFIFLASIDIAAPECLIPNFEFSTKFYLTELMPVLALAILLLIHTVYTLAKIYRFGKEAKWSSHVSRLVGIFVLILYVLYLSLTKKALDVFNCNPLDPDDGFSYTTFSSLLCDGGGLCRCGEPGGVQESLIAPAIAFLIIYAFGFPMAVFSIVYRYSEQIREDQYLRANQLGDRRETNPRAYDVRKKFQLMYMHFKPKYSFWMLSILGRKFGIAFASLMFRGNPSFQLAVVLIVLFVAFTLQVSIRPYMSPGEYPVVVKELNDNSKKADEDLERYAKDREMYRKVGECLRIQAELARKEKMHRHKMGAGFWEDSKAAAREHDKRSATEKYFFDLNAVESTLLGCLIIISLSGIMFESGRFQSRADLEWQGNLIIALVFIVLFGSLAYYLLVLINELMPHRFARYCGRFFLRYQNEGLSQEDLDRMKDNELRLDANPLFAANGPIGDKSKSLMKEIEASKNALALAKRQNDELKRLKTELEAQNGGQSVSNPLVGGLNPVFANMTDRLSSGQSPYT